MELCGVAEIDNQHLFLVEAIAEAKFRIAQGAEFIALLAILGKLEEFASEHFFAEEKLMKEWGFPDYEGNKQQHENFTRVVQERIAGLREGNELEVSLLEFVEDWISHHILVEAKQFREHLQTKSK